MRHLLSQGKHRESQGGVSLIELLVVVVILGVILVAAIPGIAKYLPRYRVERVAENLVQAVRVARHGAVTGHVNHIMRFWADAGRTLPASYAPASYAVAVDILVDRNNNMVADLPPAGDDKIIWYPAFYKDVVVTGDPTDGGAVLKPPYPAFAIAPNPIVFRPDGRLCSYLGGVFTEIPTSAFIVKSLTLGGSPPSLTDEIAIFKWRWVEIDALGGVKTTSKSGDDLGR